MTKYIIMDGEAMGWYAEAWTLKEIASKISSAKDFVAVLENGKIRELTSEEDSQLQSFRKPVSPVSK
jgi:hypothetical protein